MEKPNKKLGQNFLKNKSKVSDFIKMLDLKDDEIVIEIGPGTGAITRELIKKDITLICIEKDDFLVEKLKKEISLESYEQDDFLNKKTILEGDALIELSNISGKIGGKNYKLVGNIPYYITGKLFRVIEELENKPEISVLGIQKQVAERLSEKPPKMNILAASVQFWANPEIISIILKRDFHPIPKVDGAIVRLDTKDDIENSEQYYKAVKTIFKHPRKTVTNNLNKIEELDKDQIEDLLESKGILPFWRPENLDINDIKNIADILN